MPQIDPHNFLLAFATWLAPRASLEHTGTPRSLWVGSADEKAVPALSPAVGPFVAGPYTELRISPASSIDAVGLPTVGVQARTVGPSVSATWTQATAVANALLENKLPVRNVTLTGFGRLVGVLNLRGPALVEREATGRLVIVTNFDAAYVAT
jgi:hypothetical protein